MITKTIYKDEFATTLSEDKNNGFSYEGAELLFEYLEGYGTDIEFDPVALRCEYSEYNAKDYINDYYLDDYNEYCEENELKKNESYEEYFNDVLSGDERIVVQDDFELFIINTNY